MENNVPREKWLYPDRCMKKWLGWILSDHSAYMEKASISERPVEPKPHPTMIGCYQILRAPSLVIGTIRFIYNSRTATPNQSMQLIFVT